MWEGKRGRIKTPGGIRKSDSRLVDPRKLKCGTGSSTSSAVLMITFVISLKRWLFVASNVAGQKTYSNGLPIIQLLQQISAFNLGFLFVQFDNNAIQ